LITIYENYKILISGDAGFIGFNVAELFFKKFSNSKIYIVEKSNYAGNKKFQ
jgi:dTDP-D-glucose 4,6-dehydratase